jgi:pimeloyl-ACP methyl ester carboxylesterase
MLCLVAIPAQADSCYFILSCAPDTIFHPVICADGKCKSSTGSDAVPLVSMYVENHGWDVYPANIYPKILLQTDYYRAWLEFNDAGHAFGPDQKTAILQKIEELKKSNRPILVVVYIHGWHNNADNSNPESDASRNAVKFDYFIARQADEARRLFEQRGVATTPVVLGIYVGWRGDSLTTPGLKMTTIQNRAEAANRLASNRQQADDLYPSLKEIAQALHEADPHGRMIVVGHSLGGRIVTRLFMDDIAKGDIQPLGKNSLLVALEPAVGADCYDKALGPQHAGVAGPPVFISVTSQNDSAVGYIYHLGSILIPDCDASSASHGNSIGNYDPYLTHSITYPEYHEGKIDPTQLSEAFPAANAANNWFDSLGKKNIIYTMRYVHC